ncbi:MAG TPA: cysteine hydrolase family protein [Gaiellales bacterium]|jgi:nicotinamidase-related amidase|nr:cysteine hydrolase family protein [Gaiellales bacterium]
MSRALVVIDIQNDYFPGGANPLDGPDAAAAHARGLLDAFRASGEPVFHLKHVWDEPDALYLRPGTPGGEINAAVAPQEAEAVIEKTFPNAFLETSLDADLRAAGVDRIVVCGMMTSMCVDATVRAAVDLGYDVSVAHDACATMPLEFGDRRVEAPDVHAAFLAALADGYAAVSPSAELAI